MKRQLLAVICLALAFSFFTSWLPNEAQGAWVCLDDDLANGNYRLCNYWPVDPGNQWQYTTGEYHITNDIRTCSSGYSGILLATDIYKFSSYMQNGEEGILYAGCQWDEGTLEDIGQKIVLMPPTMRIGQTTHSTPVNSTFDVTLVGLETITVPAGTFNTVKIELVSQTPGKGSYKNTWWLAKGIGPVKVTRTEVNPSSYTGCIFTCMNTKDPAILNAPAELISYSTTVSDYFDTVQRVYVGYYQRPADPGGLLYWAQRLNRINGNLDEIIDAYANSQESHDLYGTINSSTIGTVIDSIYTALFGRAADAGGKNYYTTAYTAGHFPSGRRCTEGTVVLDILGGAQNEDLQSINNKLTAANIFTRTIDPELDGYNFQVTYAGESDAVQGRSFLVPVGAATATIPTQEETTLFMQTHIADAGDPILNN